MFPYYEKSAFALLEVPPGFEPGNEGFADLCLTAWLWYHVERETGIEPATSTLARLRYTTKPFPHDVPLRLAKVPNLAIIIYSKVALLVIAF